MWYPTSHTTCVPPASRTCLRTYTCTHVRRRSKKKRNTSPAAVIYRGYTTVDTLQLARWCIRCDTFLSSKYLLVLMLVRSGSGLAAFHSSRLFVPRFLGSSIVSHTHDIINHALRAFASVLPSVYRTKVPLPTQARFSVCLLEIQWLPSGCKEVAFSKSRHKKHVRSARRKDERRGDDNNEPTTAYVMYHFRV